MIHETKFILLVTMTLDLDLLDTKLIVFFLSLWGGHIPCLTDGITSIVTTLTFNFFSGGITVKNCITHHIDIKQNEKSIKKLRRKLFQMQVQ